ncbi:MDR family MFS transporter [Alkalihalobacillus sp. AL-G]|uniref:MDR family MFS transporter n=1 Tax=Alkalihalobacillus sp. AL-G TaxID=2926399 RepID=UPI00351AD5FD|nr:MFS transporter [Alkalihalobacillus sp. AL-G]
MRETWRAYREMDRNVWIRFIGESINGIAFMMLLPFLALYLKDRVDYIWQVGIVMAVSPLASVVGTMIGGRLADIYGRKPLMVVSMIGNAFVMLGFVWLDDFWSFVFLSLLLGFFNSLFHPAASAMVADVTEEKKRTEAFGLLRMGHNIGAAIGPILGASIVVFSKSIIFMISASTMFIYALLVIIWIRETLPKKERKKTEQGLNDHKEERLPSPFEVILKDKILFVFIITGVVISMSFTQTEGMLPVHFDQTLPHLTDAQNPYTYMLAFNGLLVVLFQFAVARWAGERKIGQVMLYGCILFGLGLLAVGWLPQIFFMAKADYWAILSIFLVIYAIYTLGEMLMSPVQMTFVANIAPEHLRGTYMGAAGLQWILGGVTGPILGGYLLDYQLGNVLFSILGIGCVIAGIIYLSLDRWILEDEENRHNAKIKSEELVSSE